MGLYYNSDACLELYKGLVNSPYFIDKTDMLSELIPLLTTENRYICLTRPRRFGKSAAACMIAAFFSKGGDCPDVFRSLKIGKSKDFNRHAGKHNVIFIDFSMEPRNCNRYCDYINDIQDNLIEDLTEAYPGCRIRKTQSLWTILELIRSQTQEKFIFIFDEWDWIFQQKKYKESDRLEFLNFIKTLLKGKSYVELAYMTGILPIAKQGSTSVINMFKEYKMGISPGFSEYFGFMEPEVQLLYEKFKQTNPASELSFSELQYWYNGYYTPSGEHLYNPRSIVFSLEEGHIDNYWTETGANSEIFELIRHNIADVRDDMARMVSGNSIPIRINEYSVTEMRLDTKESIFSAMVVYGLLSYFQGSVCIPNRELMIKFEMALRQKDMGYVARLALESDKMLEATLHMDTDTMTKILSFVHDTEIPLLAYNNESDLTALITLIYLSARERYQIEREEKAGRGYADFIFYPINPAEDAIILELKVDDSAEHALKQIKSRDYAAKLRPKIAETPLYTGRILAVGIAYDRVKKLHECKMEILV